jgi:hypothetical protein
MSKIGLSEEFFEILDEGMLTTGLCIDKVVTFGIANLTILTNFLFLGVERRIMIKLTFGLL